MKRRSIAALVAILFSAVAYAESKPAIITVHADRPGVKVSPTLYGIFFEDISRSADGGLYAELVNNRSFEDSPTSISPWQSSKSSAASIATDDPLNSDNPHYLKVNAPTILTNPGFHGVPVQSGKSYTLSLRARGDAEATLTVSLVSAKGETLASQSIAASSRDWNEFTTTLTPSTTDPAAKLSISTSGPTSLDMISLMPAQTWKDRNLRPDLAQFLDDMKPGFVRFPGGCWVEGDTMATAYRWKKTVLPLDRRPTVHNLWKYEATNGLGYHEYLQLCEDLGAAPLFVINVGMSHRETVPMEKMDEYVQDALDAIEYANGPTSSKWGGLRAANGHPDPFNLRFMEIGNENGGPAYDERYALFYDAIKKKYPDMNLVADLWHGTPKSRPVQILDEHYYNDPAFFIHNADKYDHYDRSKHKVYVGEYAVTRGKRGNGNLRAAVAEAAFMTGLERNSDVVVMASYAPLFAHVNYTAWSPNAINFDAARSYGTPSYYVQQLFARNRADTTLATEVQSENATPDAHVGQVGVGTWNTQGEFKDITVEADGKTLFKADYSNGLSGFTNFTGEWRVRGGNVRQTSNQEGAFALLGDPAWGDYTLSLKARKFTGAEGFLIRFHSTADNDYVMWNLGGWDNTRHAVELCRDGAKSIISNEVPGHIEPQRWYDVRIETRGDHVKCFLDGKLLHEFTYPQAKSLYATSGKAGNDIVLKVANVSNEPQQTTINLAACTPTGWVDVTTLTSPSADDENSLDNPTKVSPKTTKIDIAGNVISHTFPANSVTVLRVQTKQ